MRSLIVLVVSLPLMAAINHAKVENGTVAGVAGTSPEVRVFKGIPYAAPPVGNLRWQAPKAAANWSGVRVADHFQPACMQVPYPTNSPYFADAEPVSEDCLYANVWTAAKSAREHRPVMVWIYGGALTRGSGSIAAYDGENFAKKGVVLVTFNYRLGVFGFFAHPELTKESDRHTSGNYGILDQVAALEWVQHNIAAFGGDPKKVTIFGESAGSWSVNALVASPVAKGRFIRAIGESGANFAPLRTLDAAEKAGVRAAKGESIAELRAKPSSDLLRMTGVGARPNVDGYLLPDQTYAIFASGKQNDVTTLIGSNADEGTAFTPPSIKTAAFEEQSKRRFGDKADEFLKIYPAGSDTEAHASAAASMRDQTFGWEMRTWARLQSKTGKSKVYVYYFSHVPPGPFGKALGVYHASEIPYVFHNMTPWWTDADRKLADEMSSYWVNFATTGNPNGKGLAKWPVYQEKSDMAMGLGDTLGAVPVPHKAGLDFLDAYYAAQRAK